MAGCLTVPWMGSSSPPSTNSSSSTNTNRAVYFPFGLGNLASEGWVRIQLPISTSLHESVSMGLSVSTFLPESLSISVGSYYSISVGLCSCLSELGTSELGLVNSWVPWMAIRGNRWGREVDDTGRKHIRIMQRALRKGDTAGTQGNIWKGKSRIVGRSWGEDRYNGNKDE